MAPSARIATSRWNPSLRKPRKQKKPLNDLAVPLQSSILTGAGSLPGSYRGSGASR